MEKMEKIKKRKKTNKKIVFIVSCLLTFLSLLLYFSASWATQAFGEIDLNKILFHLTVPLDAVEDSVLKEGIYNCIIKPVIGTLVIGLFFGIKCKYDYKFVFTNKKKKTYNVYLYELIQKTYVVFSIVLFYGVVNYTSDEFDLYKSISYYMKTSSFIEDNYVEYDANNMSFPDEDRNLIHIILESVENTYFGTEQGGVMETNLMPNLYNYTNEYVSFTNSNNTGMHQISSTGWTVAGTVAQTSGVPFIVTVGGNEMGVYTNFFPGAVSVGDILQTRGYNQVYFIGSEASFAARDKYFIQHGDFEIKDYVYAHDNGLIDEGYRVWWGYEDSKLFTFAKEELLRLASLDEPFNFNLLTMNTHFEDGYVDKEGYEEVFDDQYSNVIFYSDKQIYEFVEWIKQQDFYENTSIVITGDHLSMDGDYFNDIDSSYERTVFNLFINSVVDPIEITNREFYAMDIYPTTLASMGIEIEGNRLALGTNLFSSEPTLFEKYGIEYVNQELLYRSNYFNDKIILGN